MTHDELKVLIEEKFNNQSSLHDAQIVNALYKVVELHKPNFIQEYDGPEFICYECRIHYPCDSIKAIEKEII